MIFVMGDHFLFKSKNNGERFATFQLNTHAQRKWGGLKRRQPFTKGGRIWGNLIRDEHLPTFSSHNSSHVTICYCITKNTMRWIYSVWSVWPLISTSGVITPVLLHLTSQMGTFHSESTKINSIPIASFWTELWLTTLTNWGLYYCYRLTMIPAWASCQIHQITGCLCAGNAGKVLPATAG